MQAEMLRISGLQKFMDQFPQREPRHGSIFLQEGGTGAWMRLWVYLPMITTKEIVLVINLPIIIYIFSDLCI